MTDRPIIFSAPMIQALLAGRKTKTRRVLKPPYEGYSFSGFERDGSWLWTTGHLYAKRPAPYAVGDRLWVRENHYRTDDGDSEYAVCAVDADEVREHLAAIDALPAWFDPKLRAAHKRLRPSIHMPRWASRLTLPVTEVRVERLHDISDSDAIAEGMPDFGSLCEQLDPGKLNTAGETAAETASRLRWPQRWFAGLWKSINGPDAWDANPWVAAVTFEVHRANIDALDALDAGRAAA